ncbi:helix-turn-helix domain-containing protein [Nonomuraea wenchangensis]|uniref:Helix-turn-helix domain-containing protein n=1 Tax=Nonomuraea wenchangensis TaxID=568860 RepID=A0A1I0LJY6_9ACTN|nr:helix-turn-helix transcriptional regulator [Nonomuraea wenchangensis]SEU39656.1 Helix-turn-helix domain-containing protein [Nonomuraea wenchangensis]
MFLRSRRARTTPQDLGLEPGPRRKVEGLRREEVAALAGLSTDYYQRLEQGRNVRPSDAALSSIADVLDLDEVERRHLTRLAQLTRGPRPPAGHAADRVPRNARLLLAAIDLELSDPAHSISLTGTGASWTTSTGGSSGRAGSTGPGPRTRS